MRPGQVACHRSTHALPLSTTTTNIGRKDRWTTICWQAERGGYGQVEEEEVKEEEEEEEEEEKEEKEEEEEKEEKEEWNEEKEKEEKEEEKEEDLGEE